MAKSELIDKVYEDAPALIEGMLNDVKQNIEAMIGARLLIQVNLSLTS